ncbi:MAG: hypothetical protein OIF58_07245, partial [Cohaesibacter sp.]|nr:hypothetical protein [Cohaesibacter sp.]
LHPSRQCNLESGAYQIGWPQLNSWSPRHESRTWRRVEVTFVCLKCLAQELAASIPFKKQPVQGTVWSYFRLTIKPDLGNGIGT